MFQYNFAVVLDTGDKQSTHKNKKIEYVSNQRQIHIITEKEPSGSITPVLPDFLPEESLTAPSFVTSKRREKKNKEISH